MFLGLSSLCLISLVSAWTAAAQTQHPLPPLSDPFPSLPVSHATRSFWTHSDPLANPLATHGSAGPLTADADICIIGSGITGVSAAYALSRNELRLDKGPLHVVMLEARDFCSGATGRNGGHLTPNPFLSFSAQSRSYGTLEAVRSVALENHTTHALLQFLHEQNLEDAVDLVRTKRVVLCSEEKIQLMREDCMEAQKEGIDMHSIMWLTANQTMQRHGAPHPALLIPGRSLWPLKLVTRLYNAAASRSGQNFNLTLHTHTPVTSIAKVPQVTMASGLSQTPQRRQRLHTPRGTVTCTSVLHASNAYASYLLPGMHGPDGIVSTRGQVIALRVENEKMSGALNGESWTANNGNEYWITRRSKNTRDDDERPLVILGGARDVSSSDPPFESYLTDDGTTNAEVGRQLRTFLGETFPGFENAPAEVEWEWTGIMGYTKTSDPFVGPILTSSADASMSAPSDDHEGEFISAGYTGHGMTRAYGCADVVSQLMLEELADLRNHSRNPGMWDTRWRKSSRMKTKLPEWFPRRYLTWNRI